ncbi:MAG: HD domain-containing protein [Patescibacteria group bacterium]
MNKNIYELHKKYVGGLYPEKWLELTWTHSNIILEIAKQLAPNDVNGELLKTGALVHDIGVYKCYDEDLNPDKSLPPYIQHGFIGFDILKNEGFPLEVCRFAVTHTATGFTKEDIERENLPYEKMDYIPVSVEEELVCYADKFHSKYPSFNTYEEQVERLKKFDPARELKMDTLKRKYGIPELAGLKKQYSDWSISFDEWFKSLQK